MMALPMEIAPGVYSIFLILEAENIERMKMNDPAEFNMYKLPPPWSEMTLRDIVILTPSAEDLAVAMKLFDEDKGAEAMKFLSRGYRFRPELGDGGAYAHLGKRS